MLPTIFENVYINKEKFHKILTEHDFKTKGPIILQATHKSYVDVYMLFYVLQLSNVNPSIIAAYDFANLGFLTYLLRSTGSFMLRRSDIPYDSSLYKSVFSEYVKYIIKN